MNQSTNALQALASRMAKRIDSIEKDEDRDLVMNLNRQEILRC
jgi:hypothetical protein